MCGDGVRGRKEIDSTEVLYYASNSMNCLMLKHYIELLQMRSTDFTFIEGNIVFSHLNHYKKFIINSYVSVHMYPFGIYTFLHCYYIPTHSYIFML